MKKLSTPAGKTTKNFRDHKLTIGLDLGDRSSWYCALDERGEYCWSRDWAQPRKP
jgi:transposase